MVSHPSGSDTSSSRGMFPSLDDGLFQQVGSMGSTVQLEIDLDKIDQHMEVSRYWK